MTTKSSKPQGICPSCGAPIVSEICAYCGTKTGLNTAKANMEYPTLECKEATLNFWTICFPAIFAGAFGFSGLAMLLVYTFSFRDFIFLLIGIPFFVGGSVTAYSIVCTLLRYAKIKKKGKSIQATVYGYMDDNVMLNNQPAQIAKLLVQTPNGPRFILYQLKSTLKPYGINDKIDVMVYQNYFMICKNKETIQW